MTASEPASGASTPDLSSVTHVTVEEKNTVGAMVPGMPYVAATPYLVGVAEMACSRLVNGTASLTGSTAAASRSITPMPRRSSSQRRVVRYATT